MDLKRLVKPGVRSLEAYEAHDVPCRVKLDANEAPVAIDLGTPRIETNRYPDPEAKGLKKELSRLLKVKRASILVGNGSDELIHYLITTFGGPVMFPTPTFVMYGIIARALGEKAVGVPLDKEFDLDMERFSKAIKRHRPRLVFLSTPNNPTGNCFSTDRVLRIVEASGGVVVVDEAYQPFSSKRGFLPLLADYGNLVIMRTLSKVGLAALRVGFIVGGESLIREVEKVRLPFNVNSYSQALAEEALKDPGRIGGVVKAVVSERGRLMEGLEETGGVRAYPSEANFILFKVGDPGRVHRALLKRGVLVRNMDKAVRGCLRVTVGSRRENDEFLEALEEALRPGKRGAP